MRYKVGDKVRVRKDLKTFNHYGNEWCFNDDMSEFRGKTVTISAVNEDSYKIHEDNGKWGWVDEMFEPEKTNWDKVKEDLRIEECYPRQFICNAIHRIRNEKKCDDRLCETCRNWLKQPYKEASILDDVEKKYLSAVIRPWRDKVKYIKKVNVGISEYIFIFLETDEEVAFPFFKENTMYKGMELNKEYSLQDLEI